MIGPGDRVSLVTLSASAPMIAALLVEARERSRTVTSLTDEELAALGGPQTEVVAPAPWLRRLGEREQAAVVSSALRGMAARGFATLDREETGDVLVRLPTPVAAVLAMRTAASAVLVAEQRVGELRRHRVLYAQGELGVLEEDVNPGGLHRFTVHTAARALADLAAWCNPTAVEMVAGESRAVGLAEVQEADSAAAQHLAQARVVTVLAGVVGDPSVPQGAVQRRRSVLVMPGSVELSRPERNDRLAFASVDEPGLHDALAELLGLGPVTLPA